MAITSLTNTIAIDAQRQVQKKQDAAGEAMTRLASGSKLNKASDDPAARSIATNLKANIGSATAVIGNMDSGESMVDIVANSIIKIQEQVIRMKALATQASSSTLSPELLSQLNLEFEAGLKFIDTVTNTTIYNDKNLLAGGAGTPNTFNVASNAASNGIIDMTASLTNPNSFAAAPFVVADAYGFITGAASNANVTGGTGNYAVSVTIGEKTFSTSGFKEAADGVLTLTANDNSRISFTLDNDVTGIDTAAKFEAALKEMLGLSLGNAPATFKSEVTVPDLALNNGTSNVTVSGAPEPGTYALWSQAGSNEITISNGADSWTANITADGAQDVNFSNGVSMSLGAGYLRSAAITNIGFEIQPSATESLSVTLQSGTRSSDIISTSIKGTSTNTLGVVTLNIKTQAAAQLAGNKLDDVLNVLSAQIAEVGSFQKSLVNIRDNLENVIDTSKAAYSKLNDANTLEELNNQNQAMIATQIAVASFNKAKELLDYLLRSVNA